jgi:hypothetical protein
MPPGWQVPVAKILTYSISLDQFSPSGERLNCLNPVLRNPNASGGYGWFNAAAFSNPVPGTFGNCGHDNLRGPKTVNIDFSAIKHFPIGERQSLQFRVEMFNAPEHVELGTPTSVSWGGSSNVAPPSNFGVITSTFTSMRQIQLALKYNS